MVSYVDGVDRAQAIAQLPDRYAIAVRLHDSGVPHEVIAQSLGIELEAWGAFFSLATAKLDHIQAYDRTHPTIHDSESAHRD
jgi:DNA-directed RNA polymerase specialized sigma24 family protein